MAPELDNSSIINELLKAIQQLQITSAATNEALATTKKTLAALRAPSTPFQNQSQGADTRLPFEIWERVLTFLYPSQITRLSRVSRSLYDMIAASVVWSCLFKVAFGPNVLLDTLPATPESKSYMLYMCAVSSRVCEQCLIYSTPASESNNRVSQPLPVLVPDSVLRRRGRKQGSIQSNGPSVAHPSNSNVSHGNSAQGKSQSSLINGTDQQRQVKYVGEPINKTWKIRMCLACRQEHYLDYPESIPAHIVGRYRPYRDMVDIYKLSQLEMSTVPSKGHPYLQSEYLEEDAYRLYRHKHGGEVGLSFVSRPLPVNDQSWKDRISEYCNS